MHLQPDDFPKMDTKTLRLMLGGLKSYFPVLHAGYKGAVGRTRSYPTGTPITMSQRPDSSVAFMVLRMNPCRWPHQVHHETADRSLIAGLARLGGYDGAGGGDADDDREAGR